VETKRHSGKRRVPARNGSPPRPLTAAETAARLGICTSTVHSMIKRGDLRAERIGNRFRIPASELDRFQ
jgi:excisionase family DNA binding protein